jgi:type I restriction enzyme, S subunit
MEQIIGKYKQTEIGVIPNDWELLSLGDLFDFKNGLNKEKRFFGEGTPIVNYMDVYRNNGLSSKQIAGKVTVTKQELKNYSVLKGDVLFTRTSETIDEIGIASTIQDNVKDTVFSGFVLRARPKNDLLENGYKKYCFGTENARKEITSKASYTTRALTNGRILSKVKIPIPTKSEQTAIATALSDADNYITSLEKLIVKKRLIKQGAMQELLKPKEGWEIKELGDLGETIIGLTYKPENVKTDGKLVLRSSNIQEGVLAFEDNVFVDIEVSEKLILKESDILICVRNGSRDLIGKCALISGTAIGETFGAFMSVFRSQFNKFIVHLFKSDIIKKQIDEYLGATINQITNKSLNSFEIPFPSPEEQIRITTILSDMDAEIVVLGEKLDKAKQIKQGMMQQLLTGKIRLI